MLLAPLWVNYKNQVKLGPKKQYKHFHIKMKNKKEDTDSERLCKNQSALWCVSLLPKWIFSTAGNDYNNAPKLHYKLTEKGGLTAL